jgi:two-component system chemotaxis response regulator CheB
MIGHRYSSESLAEAQALAVERALETAIRALEERGALLQRMAEQCEERAQVHSAEQFRRRAHDARNEADLVRTVLREAAEGTLRIPEGGQAEQSQAQVQS